MYQKYAEREDYQHHLKFDMTRDTYLNGCVERLENELEL